MLIESWVDFNRIHGGIIGARNAFEKLCADILRQHYFDDVGTIRCSPGDHGIDIYVGRIKENFKVFQCKYFLDSLENSQWNQIKKSLNTVLKDKERTGFKEWTLCLPKELDIDETEKFQKIAKEYEKNFDIKIHLWDGEKLLSLIRKYDLSKDWFGGVYNILNKVLIKPQKNDKFVRREIHNIIEEFVKYEDKNVFIKGMGGIGKTSFLNELNISLFDEFDCIFKFYYEENLLTSFCDCLGIPNDEDNAIKYLSLKENQRNLFLIDNVSFEYLSDKGKKVFEKYGKIIVSSRENLELPYYRLFEITDLNVHETKSIFLKYYDEKMDDIKDETLNCFVKYVPKNPLLIEMIARAARRELINVNVFLDKMIIKEYSLSNSSVTRLDTNEYKTIVEHLKDLYSFQNLKSDYKNILSVFTLFS